MTSSTRIGTSTRPAYRNTSKLLDLLKGEGKYEDMSRNKRVALEKRFNMFLQYKTETTDENYQLDLRKADLQRTELDNFDFTNADLRNARLEGAFLCGADLTGANLKDVRSKKADYSRATIDDTNMAGGEFRNSIFHSTKFSNIGLEQSRAAGYRGATFPLAVFEDVDFRNALTLEANFPDSVYT